MKIIYFAPVEWDSIKQRPQHLAQHLAKTHEFYYVQPLGMRKLKLSDCRRALHRIFSFFKSASTLSAVHIKNPIFIPFFISNKLMQRLNIWLLARQLKKITDNDTVLWVTSPVNIMPMLLPKIRYKYLIYEMMDDYVKIHQSLQHEIAKTEATLIDRADLIIATSQILLEKAKNIGKNKQSVLVGNGVDYDFFAETSFCMPAELSSMKKTVGYVGAIDKWMDLETITFVAKKRPDINFIFIGPVRVNNIPSVANLYFIGTRDYSTLPHYLQTFSACLIPFIPGEFADSINPVKLYEYFACGKPVVSNYMRELHEFNDLMYIANNKEDFLIKLNDALNEQNAEVIVKRKAVAFQNDWDAKAKVLEELLLKLPRKTEHENVGCTQRQGK